MPGAGKKVTGTANPYEEPLAPEVIIAATCMTSAEAVQKIFLYLEEQEYIK